MQQWASYKIRDIAGCACAGNAGNVFHRRRLQRKALDSDSGMHHGTCVTHVSWCMSGSLASGGGENVPGIPGACAPAIFRIWQEAHSITLATIKMHHFRVICVEKGDIMSYHYNDVTMGAMASPITSLTIVYSIVYWDADQREHESSASLVFVW